jgi:arginyl-tRNA synthetase
MESPTAPPIRPRDAGDLWHPAIAGIVPGLLHRMLALGLPADAGTLAGQIDRPSGIPADLAFPVHRFAIAAKQDPAALALQIAKDLPTGPEIERVDAAAGFVNFHAAPGWLVRTTLDAALAPGSRFGQTAPEGPSVCVEHTSANPTGPFHMGRVRNAIIGDTAARVLRAAGHPVTTQYYVDDVGRQSAMITWIWSLPPSGWPDEIRAAVPGTTGPDYDSPRPDLNLGRPYPAVSAYLKGHADAAAEVAELTRKLESGEAPPEHRRLAEAILRGMVVSLGRIGIHFDEFVWESSFLRDRSVEDVVARLRAAPHAVVEENGAAAIDAAGYGLPKESSRIIVTRGNGTTLYVTRDIAYHLNKLHRFPRVIDVLGQDHMLHAKTLNALLEEVGERRRPEFLIYQDLTVPEGGRMSARKGSAVYLDDLLDEAEQRARVEVVRRRPELPEEAVRTIARAVAAGAVRYHILRVAPEKTVSFRWEDAMAFEGRSGPFVQYAHARACSILRKAGATDGPYPYDPGDLGDPASLALVRVLSRLPRTVQYAARTGHVHAIAGFGHEVAEAFNQFYEKVPVLTEAPGRASRIAVVAATRATLRTLLELVGVEPLESM